MPQPTAPGGYGAPPQGPPPGPPGAYGPPPGPPGPPGAGQPGWGPPPQAGGFAPADPRMRVGTPDGLNPYGATMAPDQQHMAPGAPPPAGMPPQGPPPGPPQGPPPGVPPQGRWNNPEAFAATAPPATGEEHEAQQWGSVPPAQPTAPSQPPEPSAAAGQDPELVPEGAPRTLAGFLVSFEDNELGAFWPLYQGQNVIGRKDAMEGLDIQLDHPTTSSRHAIIHASARPGRLKLEDPGSTNGTFINDEKLDHSVKRELKDGDDVRFGGYSTVVKIL